MNLTDLKLEITLDEYFNRFKSMGQDCIIVDQERKDIICAQPNWDKCIHFELIPSDTHEEELARLKVYVYRMYRLEDWKHKVEIRPDLVTEHKQEKLAEAKKLHELNEAWKKETRAKLWKALSKTGKQEQVEKYLKLAMNPIDEFSFNLSRKLG